MQFITTRDATKATGLSTEQLREWTSRRALIPADIKPKGHGSQARYSWQTILLLRLAVVFRDRFKLELQAHRELFSSLREGLSKLTFASLWGKSLALHGGQQWNLVDAGDVLGPTDDCIVLRLDPHLEILSEAFSFPLSMQFQLFAPISTDSEVVAAEGR